jgi:hypothetical protein
MDESNRGYFKALRNEAEVHHDKSQSRHWVARLVLELYTSEYKSLGLLIATHYTQ